MMWIPRKTRWIHRGAVFLIALSFSAPLGAEESRWSGSEAVAAMDALLLNENQALKAFESRSRRLQLQAEQAESAWPEPSFEYMLDLSAPWSPHFESTHSFRVMQMIPRSGSREAQGAPARAEAASEYVEQRAAAQDLLRDGRLDLLALARLEAREALYEEERRIIDDALEVLAGLIPVGRGEHGDLLQLELARESLLDEVETLRNEREEVFRGMAARAGTDLSAVRDVLEGIRLSALLKESIGALPPEEELLQWAREEEPGLGRFEASQEVVDARIRLVDERVRPMPELMAGYMNGPPMWEMDGPRMQMFQLGVKIPLPVFRRQYDLEGASWQEAAASIQEEQGQYLRELEGRIEALRIRWESAQHRLQRYERELVPMAEDYARQILVGLELGERTSTEFLLAMRQEIALSRQMIELQYRRGRAEIELQRWTGGRLGAESSWAYPMSVGVQR